jgi:addiction module HigA family antidote
MPMLNPAHPGSILRDYMGDRFTVSGLAKELDVTREHLSAILNERSGISPMMALKLDEVFGTSEGLWYKLQTNYDLAEARRKIEMTKKAVAVQMKGKSSHPEFEPVKVFVRKKTHKSAQRKWEDTHGGDFSDLVEHLLTKYVTPEMVGN